ncbi:MAG: glycosyltransferase [Fusobacterium mortiferum]|nr:glycosyltransferase [Fusobacterium mortiferum]
MKNFSKYSVLMSLYKNEKVEYLNKSIMSMILQTVEPDEIVIVKDGPLTKELENTLDYYLKKYPNLFKIITSEKNLGLGLALNLGLYNCKNELVARMDTDDISLPTRCEKQLKKFSENKELGIVGTMIDEFSEDEGEIISSRKVPITYEEIYKFSKRRSPFNHPTVMYKKSLVLDVGGYKDLKKCQDFNLFGRMLQNGVKAENIPETLLLFRAGDNFMEKRGNWLSTKSYIKSSYDLFQIGYTNILDFLYVFFGQLTIFIVPIFLRKIIYKRLLRKDN